MFCFNRFVLVFLSLVLLLFSSSLLADKNRIGIDSIYIKSQGNACVPFGPDSGCEDSNESFRLYYGFSFTPDTELRISYSSLDIKITSETDGIFNSPSVNSDVLDAAMLFKWPIGGSWTGSLKTGLGYWTESLPGASFFLATETNSGISPVIGYELEWGKGMLRANLSYDLFLSMDQADTVSIVGLGFRFVF